MRQQSQVRVLVFIAAALGSCLVILMGQIGTAVANSTPQTPQEEWLSRSPEARLTYVKGYLDGFERGKRDACYFYEDKMPTSSPVPVEKLPRRVCLDSLPEFTEKSHYQIYVDIITNYCAKYPHDREGAPTLIMDLMANPPAVMNIDQIHAKLGG